MKEQIIEFYTAKLAKEKGFKGYKSPQFYYKDGSVNKGSNTFSKCWNTWDSTQGVRWSCPSQSLLQKWLRDEHKILLYPMLSGLSHDNIFFWSYSITDEHFSERSYNTYEEALEAGLLEALKLI